MLARIGFCMKAWVLLVVASLLLLGCTRGQVNTVEKDEYGYLVCGGVAGFKCPEGMVCVSKKTPDAGGYCMPQYVDPPRYENGTLNIPS